MTPIILNLMSDPCSSLGLPACPALLWFFHLAFIVPACEFDHYHGGLLLEYIRFLLRF